MNKNDIVTINGRGYDALTGLPVETPTTPKKESTKKAVASNVIHAAPQKSKTLQRRTTKKPTTTAKETPAPIRRIKQSMDIARSKSISRFAPQTVSKPSPIVKGDIKDKDIAPVLHPSVVKAHVAQQAKVAQAQPAVVAHKTPATIKKEAIAEALAKPAPKPKKKKTFLNRHRRFINITGLIIIVLLVGGYLTYVNLPSLSVSIAAAQANIKATYPEYHPDGYKLDGPVTYTNGSVKISFKATTGTGAYTITQTRSSWDSTALQNQVNTDSAGQFITTQQQGLTIYTYGNNAAWVNAGILYRIQSTGNALLSGDQIRQIAISM